MQSRHAFSASRRGAKRFAAFALVVVWATACNHHDRERASEPVLKASPPASADALTPTVDHLKASGQLGPGRGTLIVDIQPPENGKLTEGGPLVVKASGKDLKFPESLHTKLKTSALPVRLPVDVADGALGPAVVDVYYYWCKGGNSASCQPERARLYVDLDLTGSAAGGEAHFTHRPSTL